MSMFFPFAIEATGGLGKKAWTLLHKINAWSETHTYEGRRGSDSILTSLSFNNVKRTDDHSKIKIHRKQNQKASPR